MNFVNCTPHALTVEGLGMIPVSGIVPRCATVRSEAHNVGGVRLVRQTVGQVTGLPESAPDTVYIVSGMVLGALNGTRPDVVAPDTGADAVRENGQIVAVKGFVC
jgi:hypothetical protein